LFTDFSLFKILAVLGVAASPILEIRGAIPLGVAVYHLPLPLVFALGFLGNLVPALLILLLLDPFVSLLRHKSTPLHVFFEGLFALTRRKHTLHFERFGSLALFLFVAIPLPGTGAWTGALLAYLFGLGFRFSFLSIALGIIVAGAIISMVTLGGVGIASLL